MKTPRLKATFQLEAGGIPAFVESSDLKHYRIRLEVEDAPEDTYAVTYELDPSYYDRVREARDPEQHFAEDLTSYGDYVVQVKLRSPAGTRFISAPLSAALRAGHEGDANPHVAEAVREIAAH